MKHFIVAFPLFLCITSCTEQMESQKNTYESVDIIKQELIQAEENKEDNSFEPDVNIGSITIECLDFDFTISHTSIYEDRVIDIQDRITIESFLDLGEYLDSATIEIHHPGLYNFDIFQMHENILSISNEGPYCDVVNWKHYYSDWIAIKKLNNYDFVAETYSEEDYSRFSDADINDLEQTVLDNCGEEWAERVVDVKSFNEYPCSVGLHKIYFKIVLTNEQGELYTQQFIKFELPLGC